MSIETSKLGTWSVDADVMDAKQISDYIENTFVHLSGDNNIGTIHLSGNFDQSEKNTNILLGNNCFAKGDGNIAGCKIQYIAGGSVKDNVLAVSSYAGIEVDDVIAFKICDNHDIKIIKVLSKIENFETTFDGETRVFKNALSLDYDLNEYIRRETNGCETESMTGHLSNWIRSNDNKDPAYSDENTEYFVWLPNEPLMRNEGVVSEKSINGCTAIGISSYAENSSLAVGSNNKASGKWSCAIGRDNYSAYAAAAIGRKNTASGQHSFAEGFMNVASGQSSHAEGQQTTASGRFAHSENFCTEAIGKYSHAGGYLCRARDHFSYTWSGINPNEDGKHPPQVSDYYESHGDYTYNINPKNGTSGFYIGEQSLCSILSDAIPEVAAKDFYKKSEISDNYFNKTEIGDKYFNKDMIFDLFMKYPYSYNEHIDASWSGNIIKYGSDVVRERYEDLSSKGNVLSNDFCLNGALSDITEIWKTAKNFNIMLSQSSTADARSVLFPNIEKLSSTSLTATGNYAFESCKKLTDVKLPNLSTLNSATFRYCDALSSVEISNVTRIEGSAFRSTMISNGYFPKAEFIGNWSFADCVVLTSLYIPNANDIEQYFLNSTKNLSVIDFTDRIDHSVVPTLQNTYCFANAFKPLSVAIPTDMYDAWSNAPIWKDLIADGKIELTMPLAPIVAFTDMSVENHGGDAWLHFRCQNEQFWAENDNGTAILNGIKANGELIYYSRSEATRDDAGLWTCKLPDSIAPYEHPITYEFDGTVKSGGNQSKPPHFEATLQ